MLFFNGRNKLRPPDEHIRDPRPLSSSDDETMLFDKREWRCDLLSDCISDSQETLGGIDVYTGCFSKYSLMLRLIAG